MKRITLRTLIFAAALTCTSARSFAQKAPAAQQPAVNALWVYSVPSLPDPVTDSPTRSTLMQNGSASGVNMLYVSVYSSTPDSQGRHLVGESSIATFIVMAHAQGMQVYAAMGDPDWPSDGCSTSNTPYARFSDIGGYNAANSSARFDGIMLDVEPGSSPDYSALLSFYQCFQQMAGAKELGLSAAISAFWTGTVTFNGVTEAAYQQIVDLKLNSVVVMGYRNSAGTSDCTQGDGILCLDEPIIAYADSTGQGGAIIVGLNTDNPATSGDSADETFYSMGQAAMNIAAQSVASQLAAANQIFGGFSVNNYRDSYLNGQLSGWPAINPDGPISAAALPTFSTASVTNAASMTVASVAPGELITIFGQNLGPNTPQGLQLTNGNASTSLAGVQVFFNGVAAPMILAYSTQLNVVVPFKVQGSASVTVEVAYNNLTSAPVTLPVTQATVGIFTANASGTGQAAALNADYSVNNSAHPAAPGSFVTLYLTGAGQTSPGGVDGFVDQNAGTLSRPVLPVTAEIGGVAATLLDAGSSVDIVSGVMQVTVAVPSGLAAGQQPVTVSIGSGASQTGVTVAVE
jgi:uncharacterized protein (TIGR03437 family)